MLQRRKAPKMGVRESTRIECPSHRQWVRGCECLVMGKMGHVCGGIMHAHHVRKGTHTGMSQDPDDCEVVPLCAFAHDEVHKGHDTFEAKYRLNLSKEAAIAWRISPAGQRYRLKTGKSR